jgi:hypothetical protein
MREVGCRVAVCPFGDGLDRTPEGAERVKTR